MSLPKRSECRCLCHSDANILGMINVPMHVMPCCYDDIGEKKMSVRELNFDNGYFKVSNELEDRFVFKIDVDCAVAVLDRNQAHLLYLYLKERFEGK